MSGYTVAVTGATGKTGRPVVSVAQARGWTVRALARRRDDPEWTPFDWDDRDTWHPAFAGGDAAYVLIPFNHPGAPEVTPDIIRTAAAAGVSRIVLLSSLDAEHADADSPLRVCEEALLDTGVASAILRPTWFFDNFTTGSFAGMVSAGDLRLPAGDGRIPFVDVRNIADFAVAAMAADGPTGILDLTGPEAINHTEVAEALTIALGYPVTYHDVSIDEFVARMAERGFGVDYGQFLGEALQEVATGALVIPVADAVLRVCGRHAYDVHQFARHFVESQAAH